MRPRLVGIFGPTAAGKSELAVWLARRLGGEVVSVDSRQVYRRLDIGTAKPEPALRAAVPHHLLDVVDPDEPFDAARYAALARAAIAEIGKRGRAVVLCGGSGLYLRALAQGLFGAAPPDQRLRRRLDARLSERGSVAVHAELAALDPEAAARIAPRDAARIRRALEVVLSTGRPLSVWQSEHGFRDEPYEILSFVLSPPVEELARRIERRAAEMWRRGLAEETRALLAAGYDGRLRPLAAIGYREAQAYLRGELGREEALTAIVRATRHYAKRQRTWFRGLEGAQWLSGEDEREEILVACRAFLGPADGRDRASDNG